MNGLLRSTAIALFFTAIALLTGCRTGDAIAYISDAQRDSAQAIVSHYTASIQPGDRLYIYVASQTPEAVVPFNQETHKISLAADGAIRADASSSDANGQITQAGTTTNTQTQYITTDVTGYTVDEQGSIIFPILGKLKVANLTQDSLINLLERRLREEGYVHDPMVTVTLMNFRVTVVGEVRQPQQIHTEGTRLTLLEALAICGDLTDYGRRDNLTIVREKGGIQEIGEIDLTTKAFLNSPYYYLQQNDIVYVEPNDLRRRTATRDPNNPRYISTGVGLLGILNNTMRAISVLKVIESYKNHN